MEAQTKKDLNQAYSELVTLLQKPGDAILATTTAERLILLHHTLGISGEAGEIVDAVKKHVIYNQPLDLDNLIEELGDLEFYLQGLRSAIGIDRDITLIQNINKLSVRYGNSYSDVAAKERKDKL